MKKSIRTFFVAILAVGFQNALAGDNGAKGNPGMSNMDKEHMQHMHEHMDEMHKSKNMGKGDATCDMKSDGKCAVKDMKPENKAANDKPHEPAKAKGATNADEHSAHHP